MYQHHRSIQTDPVGFHLKNQGFLQATVKPVDGAIDHTFLPLFSHKDDVPPVGVITSP